MMDWETLNLELGPEKPFATIRAQIPAQLYCVPLLHSREIHAMLCNEPEGPDLNLCVDELRALLIDKGAAESVDAKRRIGATLIEDYPESYDKEVKIETPKQYIKRSDADTCIRPQLRAAREAAIQNSRQRLNETIAADATHLDLRATYPDEQLQVLVLQHITQAHQSIKDAVEHLEDVYPEKRGTTQEARDDFCASLPPYADAVQAMGLFMPVVVPDDNNTFLPSPECVTDETICRYVIPPMDNTRLNEVETAMQKVRASLERYIGLTPENIAQAVCKELSTDLSDRQEARLTHALASIVLEELATLEQNVHSAYEQVPRRKTHKPESEKANPSRKRSKATPKDTTAEDIEPAKNDSTEKEVVELEIIEDAFPWTNGNPSVIELHKNPRGNLLVAEAFSPAAQSIRAELREESAVAKKLDGLTQRVVEVEHDGHASSHPRIKQTRNTDFHNLSVLYYNNLTANGTRLYYARTNAAQYPKIAEVIQQHGVAPDTQMLIILGETDKQHQPDLLVSFGVSRRNAYLYAGAD